MPIPVSLLAKVLQLVLRTAKTAFRGRALLRKVDAKQIGKYLIEITRRGELGIDGAISQVVRIYKDSQLEEAWHIVTKAGKIIHKHILK